MKPLVRAGVLLFPLKGLGGLGHVKQEVPSPTDKAEKGEEQAGLKACYSPTTPEAIRFKAAPGTRAKAGTAAKTPKNSASPGEQAENKGKATDPTGKGQALDIPTKPKWAMPPGQGKKGKQKNAQLVQQADKNAVWIVPEGLPAPQTPPMPPKAREAADVIGEDPAHLRPPQKKQRTQPVPMPAVLKKAVYDKVHPTITLVYFGLCLQQNFRFAFGFCLGCLRRA